MHDANEIDFAPSSDPYGYAAEDALYMPEHGDHCGCRDCSPDDARDMALELEAGRWARW